MANDLVARMRLEAEANVDAIKTAEQAQENLRRSAENTAQSLNRVADASAKVDQAASSATDAAGSLAEGLQAANDAGEKAAEAVGKGKEALDAHTVATAKSAAGAAEGAAAQRGLAVALGETVGALVATTIAGAALAAGAALVAAAAGAMREEWDRAARGLEDAADILERVQDEAKDTADLVAHLADETGNSATQADAAAGAYDRQALAAANLNQKLREMNSLKLVDTFREAQRQERDLEAAYSGGGLVGLFQTNAIEAEANARRALLRGLGFNNFGDTTGAGRTEDQAIAAARANAGGLSTKQQKLLDDYNAAQLTRSGTADAIKAQQNYLAAIRRQMNGQDDDVTLLDEIVVEPPRASKARKPATTEEERDAKRRLDNARQMQVAYNLEARALAERSKAALEGETALEALRVKEAGLRVLERQGVESLDELTGKVKDQTAAAVKSAEAVERQAIATEKAERVGSAARDLDRAIASEERRAKAIAGGAVALEGFNQAEAIRQQVERVGLTLTDEQVKLLTEKATQLAQIQAANDNAEYYRQQAEELRLLQLTNQERDLEQRKLRIINELKREGKEITEAEAKARALVEQGAYENAQAIGGLKEDLKRAFIETGELSFDSVADYAEKKLREAVYNALLAEPIDIIINAVVGNISGLTGSGGSGGGLLASLLGGTPLGEGLGGAFTGYTLGKALGLGTGKSGTDSGLALGGSLAGTALAYSSLSAGIAGGVTAGALSLGASTTLAGAAGALLSSAAVLGPLGAIAALALGSFLKDDQRPYARSDIGIVNGQFAVTGGQELDNGPLSEIDKAAQQISTSLNAAADLFKLDLTKVDNLPTSIGYVSGKNTGALSQGYFGGDGGGFSTGAQFEGYSDPSALAADIVKATIIRAIEAGASDLSEAEKRVVLQASTLEEAANKIALGRSIVDTIDDAILQLTDPAAFERKKALDAIEASYQALKDQANELIEAGLVSGDVLAQLDQLKQLQINDALSKLGGSVTDAENALRSAWQTESAALTQHAAELERTADALGSYRKQLYLGAAAGLSPEEQYKATKAEFERVSALARAGDESALAELPTTSQQFLEASRAYYASSAGYFRDLEAVRTAVTGAETLARSQIDILTEQLDVEKESLKTLIALNDNVLTLPQAIADLVNAKAAAGGATTSDTLPSWFDPAQYAADNPDLRRNYDSGGILSQYGSFEAALIAHFLGQGQYEIAAGTRKYGAGGIFGAVSTNQVVTSPTLFNVAEMAEAGPEAIMPLFRGPRGLGVVVSNDNGRTEQLLAAVIVELQALVNQGGAAATAQIATLQALAEEIATNTRAVRSAA